MAWRRPGDKSLIIQTNDGYFTDAYMRHSASMSQRLIQSFHGPRLTK